MESNHSLHSLFRTTFLFGFALIEICTAACSPSAAQNGGASLPEPARQPPQTQPEKSLRASYIAAIQKSAGAAYQLQHESQQAWADNGSQGYFLHAGDGKITLAAATRDGAAGRLELALREYGCAGHPEPAAPASMAIEGNSIAWQRDKLREWYLNGPLGLEQGFTWEQRPDCAADEGLALTLELGGSLRAELDRGMAAGGISLRDDAGRTVMRYTDLYAQDAAGRALASTMELRGSLLTLRVDAHDAQFPIVIDPLVWLQQQKLVASDGAADDNFGLSVAASGDTVVVGAPSADLPGAKDAGAAYVFVRSGTTWMQQQKLTAMDFAAGDQFGVSVSVDGDTALVGAHYASLPGAAGAGAAYVFVRAGTTWTQQAKLTAADAAAGDGLGQAVALSGDTAAVGASAATVGGATHSGAAYVFVRAGTSWTQQAKLSASDKMAFSEYGWAIAADVDTVVVGAPYMDQTVPAFCAEAGAAYVYIRSGTSWSEQAKLSPPAPRTSDHYAGAVAISGDTLIVGIPDADNPMTDTGGVRIYARAAGVWSQTATMPLLTSGPMTHYGNAVAASGSETAAGVYAGVPYPPGAPRSGWAGTFAPSGTSWIEEDDLYPADGADNDGFGYSVGLSGTTAILGSPFATIGGASRAGAAYVFVGMTPKPNGAACTQGHACASNYCVDGVCCDSTCLGGFDTDCLACSKAKGASTDGTCGVVTAGVVCHKANGPCDADDVCDGVGMNCNLTNVQPKGTLCRAAASVCDAPEYCNGMNTLCPTDAFMPATTVCRMAAGACDKAELCTGFSATCPVDAFKPNSTVCRAAADVCDTAEYCTGTGVDCPADAFLPATTICRQVAGPCDVAESCTGAGAACPPDQFAPSTLVCRAAASVCDAVESCTGTGAACPSDAKQPATKVCRAAAGVCDTPEYCTGTTDECPSNAFLPTTTVCRAAQSSCDGPEMCSGDGPDCGPDLNRADGYACEVGSCQAGVCRPEADLGITLTASPVQASGREPLTLTAAVVDAGRGEASDVQVSIRLPPTAVAQSATGSGWSCQYAAESATCSRSQLAVGPADAIQLVFLPSYQDSVFTVEASVQSATVDPSSANNTSRLQVQNGSPSSATGCSYAGAHGEPPRGHVGIAVSWLLLALGTRRRPRARRQVPAIA